MRGCPWSGQTPRQTAGDPSSADYSGPRVPRPTPSPAVPANTPTRRPNVCPFSLFLPLCSTVYPFSPRVSEATGAPRRGGWRRSRGREGVCGGTRPFSGGGVGGGAVRSRSGGDLERPGPRAGRSLPDGRLTTTTASRVTPRTDARRCSLLRTVRTLCSSRAGAHTSPRSAASLQLELGGIKRRGWIAHVPVGPRIGCGSSRRVVAFAPLGTLTPNRWQTKLGEYP